MYLARCSLSGESERVKLLPKHAPYDLRCRTQCASHRATTPPLLQSGPPYLNLYLLVTNYTHLDRFLSSRNRASLPPHQEEEGDSSEFDDQAESNQHRY